MKYNHAGSHRRFAKIYITLVVAFLLFAVVSITFASLTFNASGISGDSGMVIDGAGTIWIGTSTATGIVIGKTSSTVSLVGSSLSYTAYEPQPVAPTVALAGAGAGNVDNGAHVYVVTCYHPATGESTPSAISSVVTVADKTTNGQVNVTLPLCSFSSSGGDGRNVYRSKAGVTNPTNSQLFLVAAAPTATPWQVNSVYTDNVADASLLNINPPTVNTANAMMDQWTPDLKFSNGSTLSGTAKINWDLPYFNTTTMNGLQSVIRQSHAVNTGALIGANFSAYVGYSTGDSDANVTGAIDDANVVGVLAHARNRSTNTVQMMAAFDGEVDQTSAGKTTYAAVYYAPTPSGNIDNVYGFYMDPITSGNISKWGFYQVGTEPNHFGGSIGIGTTQPSSTLHIYQGGALQVGNSTLYASSTSGNVGIGTTQPSSTLHVAGASSTIRIGTGGSNPGCVEMYDVINSSTLEYMYFSSSTIVGTTTKPSFCQ